MQDFVHQQYVYRYQNQFLGTQIQGRRREHEDHHVAPRGCATHSSGFVLRVWGSGFRVQGLGFRLVESGVQAGGGRDPVFRAWESIWFFKGLFGLDLWDLERSFH